MSYVGAAILVTSLYAIIIAGAGWIFVRVVFALAQIRPAIPRHPEVLSCFSAGLGLYAGIWICVGLLGQFRPIVVLACLVPGLAGAASAVAVWWSDMGRFQIMRDQVGRWWRGLEAILILILVLLAIATFGPPTGDAVAFYMAWPKIIAASGIIAPLLGYEHFSSIWVVAEMHFAALMVLDGEPAAKFFIWYVVVACVGWVWELSRACGLQHRGRILAACMVLTSTAIALVSWDGKTDLMAVPLALASVWWVLLLRTTSHKPAIVLVGWLAATAVAAKMSYLIPLSSILLVLIFWRYSITARSIHGWVLEASRGICAIAVAAALVSLPQILKNLLLLGQPFAPIVWFKDGHVGCCGLADSVWYSPSIVRQIILTFPFVVTFGNYWAQYGVLSPLALGLLPFALFWRPSADEHGLRLRWVTLAAIAGMAAWLCTTPSQVATRYFLGPLLLFVVLPAWLGETASREAPAPVRIAIPLTSLVLAGAAACWTYSHADVATDYMMGQVGIVRQMLPIDYGPAANVINAIADPGARVLLVGYTRYYLRSDLLQCLVPAPALDREDYRAIQDLGPNYFNPITQVFPPESFQLKRLDASVFRRLGIEFILWDKFLKMDLTLDSNAAHVFYEDEFWTLYRIESLGGGDDKRITRCQQATRGRWLIKLWNLNSD
jgi:hypothetical protein